MNAASLACVGGWAARLTGGVVLGSLLSACVMVRAQQRAVLADPVMQFDGEPRAEALRVHALENREGSFGGSGVAGGGCGCN